MTTSPPIHHDQILRNLPTWSKDLKPAHASRLITSQRKAWMGADGFPYDWYIDATDAQQKRLRDAVDVRDSTVKALAPLLAPLQGISEYCRPLLEKHLPAHVSVDKVCVYQQAASVDQPSVNIPGKPGIYPGDGSSISPKGERRLQTLLEAALHNFKGVTDTARFAGLQADRGDTRPPAGLSLSNFILACRAADLGQKYQNHLATVFDGSDAQQIQALSMQARRDELRVQTRIAELKGHLSSAGFIALHGLTSPADTPTYDGKPLYCWLTTLEGVPVHDLLLMGPADDKVINPVVLYFPGDDQAIREFASWSIARTHFGQRLQDETFRNRVIAQAPVSLQPTLRRKLLERLYSNADAAEGTPLVAREHAKLDVSTRRLSDPWLELEHLHVARIKADARYIAIPTADVDAEARRERIEFWLDMGMNVVNIAAFYVPALSPIMLTLGGSQIVGSVFHAVEAWEDGDNALAMAQLESLLVNVAITGLTVAGGAAVHASTFVDQLTPIEHAGRELLWQADLQGYASSDELPETLEADPQGQYRHAGKTYIRLQDTFYEQFQDHDGQWRVRHPGDSQAFSPAVLHNQGGGWRLAYDSPLDWDSDTLIDRQGPLGRRLNAEARRAALYSTGIDEAVLRRQLIEQKPAPAQLQDALLRLAADEELTRMIDRVRDGLPVAAHRTPVANILTSLPEWPQDHVLEVFSGSERWGESSTYPRPAQSGDTRIQISRDELENGALAKIVLEQLGEAQADALAPVEGANASRVAILQARLADQMQAQRSDLAASLVRSNEIPADAAMKRLGAQFGSLPGCALEEIVAHASTAELELLSASDGRVPLRILEEARLLQADIRLSRAILGLHAPNLATADTALLRAELQSPTLHNDAQLFEAAIADRAAAARLIGQQPIRPGFRSPLRLSSGRLGYPLSGRMNRRGPAARLRTLYPEMPDRERATLERTLSEAGNLGDAIARLEAEHTQLRHTLRTWEVSATDFIEHEARAEVSQRLQRAWRREGAGELTLDEARLTELPDLNAQFPGISRLTINDLELERLQPTLFACFPALEELQISGNPQIDAASLAQALKSAPGLRKLSLSRNALTGLSAELTSALANMRHLRTLDLSRNNLTLTAADITFFAQRRLEVLNLRHNSITLDQPTAERFQDMIDLRELNLSMNPLAEAPDVRYMARLSSLNLSNASLSRWPAGLTTLMSQAQYQLRELDLSFNEIETPEDLDAILVTPYARDAGAQMPGRRWNFNYNTLEENTRTRLRAIGLPVFEHFAEEAPVGDAFWQVGLNDEQLQTWHELESMPENRALFDQLSILENSAEAQRQPEQLRARVWSLLEQAASNTALRERLNEVADAYPVTCGDAASDAFSALEAEVSLEQIGTGDASLRSKWRLLSKLYRRAQVNNLADRISLARTLRKAALQDQRHAEVQTLPPLDPLDDPAAYPDDELIDGLVDDIEVRLSLRQDLAEELDYPEPGSDMLFAAAAKLNARVRDNVVAQVRRLEASQDARLNWLLEQPTWKKSLRKAHEQVFADNTGFWQPGLDYLDYCLDASAPAVTGLSSSVRKTLETALSMQLPIQDGQVQRLQLTDGQYQRAAQALMTEQAKVEDGLYESYTRKEENS
ncbi:TPA: DUF6543 domain-containing protein [Pseudomonas putida]